MESESKFDYIKNVDAIGLDSAQVRAVEFAYNPWKFMQHFVREVRDAKNGQIDNIASIVIDELTNLLQVSIPVFLGALPRGFRFGKLENLRFSKNT